MSNPGGLILSFKITTFPFLNTSFGATRASLHDMPTSLGVLQSWLWENTAGRAEALASVYTYIHSTYRNLKNRHLFPLYIIK